MREPDPGPAQQHLSAVLNMYYLIKGLSNATPPLTAATPPPPPPQKSSGHRDSSSHVCQSSYPLRDSKI